MKPDDLDDSEPPEPDPAMLEQVQARSGAFRKRRRVQRFTSVVAGVVILTVAGGIALTHVDTTDSVTSSPTTTTTTTAAARVTTRLVLPTTALAPGATMKAHVVVENNSGHELKAVGCLSLYQVVLRNADFEPGVLWPTCAQPFTIPVGSSSYPVNVVASYSGCSSTPQADVASCLPNGRPPPIPTGTYEATVYAMDDVVPIPPPVTVLVPPNPSNGILKFDNG